MAQIVSDRFDGTTGQSLQAYNANWVKAVNNPTDLVLDANGAVTNLGAGNGGYYRNDATPPSPDYTVSADVFNGAGVPGVIGRVVITQNTFYSARVNGNTIQLFRFVNGAASSLGSQASGLAGSQVYALKLEMIGSAIKVYVNGSATPVVNATDSGIPAAGKPGIRQTNGSPPGTIDNFSADTIGADVVSGDFSSTMEGCAMQATGVVDNQGFLVASLDNATMAASGTVGNAPTGTFASQLAGASMAASGAVLNRGTFASTLQSATMVAAGAVAEKPSGAFASTLDGAAMYAVGYLGDKPPDNPTRPYRWRVMRRHQSTQGLQ